MELYYRYFVYILKCLLLQEHNQISIIFISFIRTILYIVNNSIYIYKKIILI